MTPAGQNLNEDFPATRRLWSLWDMLSEISPKFIELLVQLARMQQKLSGVVRTDNPEGTPDWMKNHAVELAHAVAQMKLTVSHQFAADLVKGVFRADGISRNDLLTLFDRIFSGVRTELQARSVLLLDKQAAELYQPSSALFGPDVEAKFSQMSEDIAEAGKCLALERPTAAVFHLMRVMELAVQRFGAELGVTLVTEKNWQNILDETNKAIGRLNHRLPRTKAFAEAASHLYNVKVAWRNEVMHPKQTYTPDEATAIFDNTRTFVRDLAGLI